MPFPATFLKTFHQHISNYFLTHLASSLSDVNFLGGISTSTNMLTASQHSDTEHDD